MTTDSSDVRRSPLREIIDPFVHMLRAPRALWGVNITYFLEGLCYFGVLTLLTVFFNENVGLDDAQAGWIVGVFTGGITFTMFFLGGLADSWGVKRALAISLTLMVAGRILLSGADLAGGTGMGSGVFFTALAGLLIVVLGYGMYQPASYAAVRLFTRGSAAAMGYAMLYALNNLGAFLAGIISPPVRGAFGISGIYWVYTVLTAVSVVLVFVFMTRRAMQAARDAAAAADAAAAPATGTAAAEASPAPAATKEPFNLMRWLRTHPLRDIRFTFFIFVLIPVQTLFAHQWLTLPQYVLRSYPAWVSDNMEFFVNLNPLLIFILSPIIAAMTERANVYRMMIIGTTVMAAPTFLLSVDTSVTLLFTYIVLMSIGEAMWQPRFLQLAAELAPEGRTGQYMGIAQLPWFLTKMLTGVYSGTMLMHYVPEQGAQNPQMLWLIHGAIAMASPLALVAARRWMGARLEHRPAAQA
jgi:proton-dependent oligopeptide transporter, POT family